MQLSQCQDQARKDHHLTRGEKYGKLSWLGLVENKLNCNFCSKVFEYEKTCILWVLNSHSSCDYRCFWQKLSRKNLMWQALFSISKCYCYCLSQCHACSAFLERLFWCKIGLLVIYLCENFPWKLLPILDQIFA